MTTEGWSVSMWCVVLGCGLLIASGGLLFYILRTRGKVRAKTQEEIRDRVLNDDIIDMPTYSVGGPGAGVTVEASATSDTLRLAGAQGEWGLFWAWPFFQFSWAIGGQLLVTAFAVGSGAPIVAWITGLIFVPAGLAGFFMAWSALQAKHSDDHGLDAPHTFDRR